MTNLLYLRQLGMYQNVPLVSRILDMLKKIRVLFHKCFKNLDLFLCSERANAFKEFWPQILYFLWPLSGGPTRERMTVQGWKFAHSLVKVCILWRWKKFFEKVCSLEPKRPKGCQPQVKPLTFGTLRSILVVRENFFIRKVLFKH